MNVGPQPGRSKHDGPGGAGGGATGARIGSGGPTSSTMTNERGVNDNNNRCSEHSGGASGTGSPAQARCVGGARHPVRNEALGRPKSDDTLAASLVPEAVCMVTDPRSGQCVLVRTHDPSAVCIVMEPRSSARHPVRNEALGTPKSDGTNGGQPCA